MISSLMTKWKSGFVVDDEVEVGDNLQACLAKCNVVQTPEGFVAGYGVCPGVGNAIDAGEGSYLVGLQA